MCSAIDSKLVNVQRFALDPSQAQDVADAIQECHAEQGASPAQFFQCEFQFDLLVRI